MTLKKIIREFYKSDALINGDIMASYLHKEVTLNWSSSQGIFEMDHDRILEFTYGIGKSYVRSKATITHILQDGNFVSVRYNYYAKTIENPREEMHLADVFVIWEIKDEKLYRGYQMSQVPLINI